MTTGGLRIGDCADLGPYTVNVQKGLPWGLYVDGKVVGLMPPPSPPPPSPSPPLDASVDPGWANVRRYGAKGDDVTVDDAAFLKARDDCLAGRYGAALFAPPGRYKLSQGLLLRVSNANHPDAPGTLCIRGAGVGATLLAADTPGEAGATIAVRGQQGVSVSDLTVFAPTGGEGIRLTNDLDDSGTGPDNSYSVIQNVWVKYGRYPIHVRRASTWLLDKVFVVGQPGVTECGIFAENLRNVDGGGGTLSKFMVAGAGDGIRLNVSGVFLDTGTVIACATGVRIVARRTLVNANITQITLQSVQLSGALDRALVIDGTDPRDRCLVGGVWVMGGQFDGNMHALDFVHGEPDGIQSVSVVGAGLRALGVYDEQTKRTLGGPVYRFQNNMGVTIRGGVMTALIDGGQSSLQLVGGTGGRRIVIDGPEVAVPTDGTVLFPGGGYLVGGIHPEAGLPYGTIQAEMAPDDTSEYWCPNVKGPQDEGYAPGWPTTVLPATGALLRRSGGVWVA